MCFNWKQQYNLLLETSSLVHCHNWECLYKQLLLGNNIWWVPDSTLWQYTPPESHHKMPEIQEINRIKNIINHAKGTTLTAEQLANTPCMKLLIKIKSYMLVHWHPTFFSPLGNHSYCLFNWNIHKTLHNSYCWPIQLPYQLFCNFFTFTYFKHTCTFKFKFSLASNKQCTFSFTFLHTNWCTLTWQKDCPPLW